MAKMYCVVFWDLQESRDHFTVNMERLGVSASMVERILRSAPIILKGGMTQAEADGYARAVRNAGGKVGIHADGIPEGGSGDRTASGIEPFTSFTMCPQCGYKQMKVETCIKCGFFLKP